MDKFGLGGRNDVGRFCTLIAVGSREGQRPGRGGSLGLISILFFMRSNIAMYFSIRHYSIDS